MNEVILSILGIGLVVIAFGLLSNMQSVFLKKFEKSCIKAIEERDKELKEKEELNKALRKWLFR